MKATHTGYVRKLDKLGWVRVCAADKPGSAVVFDGHFMAGEQPALMRALFDGAQVSFGLDDDGHLVNAVINYQPKDA